MKKIIILLMLTYGLQQNIFCQSFAINATGNTSDVSAILDVSSNIKGMLIPRMTTAERTAITTPANGLILYDTDDAGFWFYNGTSWQQFTTAGNTWGINGNTATNPATNFIGTTDNQPLRFRINNIGAGIIDTGSSYSTAIGFRALDSATTGIYNVAVGYKALISNSTGNANTALGTNALRKNTDGYFNTANGFQALSNNTTGFYNTANGFQALLNNSIGSHNTANGLAALSLNTTGSGNTATGAFSLYADTAGIGNTANGYASLYTNRTGNYNTANGWNALYNNTTGKENIAVGPNCMHSNTTGNFNTASGDGALYFNVGGDYNIAMGFGAGTHPSTPNIFNTISIGNNGILNAYQNQVLIGNTSIGWIGGQVTWSTYSDARIKNTVAEDVRGLDFILRLRPVTYFKSIKAMAAITGDADTKDFAGKYDIEKIRYSGFIAQEVEAAANKTGYNFSGIHTPQNSHDLYSLSYESFVVPLVKATQELADRNTKLTQTVDKQQQLIENLQKQIALLEKRLTALEIKK